MNGKLYSFNSSPTINNVSDVEFIIHGFNISENNQLITEDLCRQCADSIINKPILAKYFYYGDNQTDHFGDHEVFITTDRNTGEDMIATDTIALGVFTSWEIKEVNNEKVFIAKGILWTDRYFNACNLLYEQFNKGIEIKTSCEYLYSNYEVKDGIQYIKYPIIYDGHTILNSEERGDSKTFTPAYKKSLVTSLNQAIKTDLENKISLNNINKNKINDKGVGDLEKENIFLKSLNDISFGETREKIYSALAKVMIAEDYNSMWLSNWDIYDTYFIYENYNGTEWIRFKVEYTKDENDEITVNYDSRVQVVRQDVYVEVSEVKSLNTKIDELTNSLNTKSEELNIVKGEKEALNETVLSLNTKIEELQPFKAIVETQEYEKALNEKKAYYEEKFSAMNAKEKFNSEEVQALIKETLNTEKSLNAKATLGEILTDLIKPEVQVSHNSTPSNQKGVESLNSKLENLTPPIIKTDLDIYNE